MQVLHRSRHKTRAAELSCSIQIVPRSRPDSVCRDQVRNSVECKFCDVPTPHGYPICNDCYRELGAGE